MQNIIRKIKRNGSKIIIAAGIIIVSVGLMNFTLNRDFRLTKNMDIFFSFIREISLFYVDETDPEKLIEDAIYGVLDGLDPFTTFVPESERENYETMTTGRYGGIGAMIRQSGDFVMIGEPYEGFPAQKAGLRAGDLIIAINGRSIKGKPVSEVSELLKGTPGSRITISVNQPGNDTPVQKDIVREEVRIDNVVWHGVITDDIGYIRFSGFTENAHQEVRDALNDLKSRGARKLILDVRGNPGGLLWEAVNITNLFVESGQEIVSTRGKVKQWEQTYRARNRAVDTEIPVVVLVNHSSASAAEIVAGAIQDLDRGLVIGQRTFGKGLIQTTRQLSYNAQLKITTAKYYTPSGRCIQSVSFSENGPVNIPDSLINEFRTRNGRIVYDGGGIIPDISIPEEMPGPVIINLYTRNFIFDFATKYASGNSQIPPVREFQLSNDDYALFLEFLEEAEFDFQTQTERQFAQLLRIAKEEKYYDRSNELFEELETKIQHDKHQDLEIHREAIKSLLREEIVSRYYFQKGRLEASLDGDPVLEKAIEILGNLSFYHSLLEGTDSYTHKQAPAYSREVSSGRSLRFAAAPDKSDHYPV